MTDEDTIFSNPLTGETVRKPADIEAEAVPGAEDLPGDVPSTAIPPELEDNVGTDVDDTDPGLADPPEE